MSYPFNFFTSFNSLTAPKVKCLPGLETPVPAGFFLQDKWMSLVCETRPFPSPEQVSTCIKDKHILMMGDSTLRQWFEYLLQTVPSKNKLHGLQLTTSESFFVNRFLLIVSL